jgi:hypothetical protein
LDRKLRTKKRSKSAIRFSQSKQDFIIDRCLLFSVSSFKLVAMQPVSSHADGFSGAQLEMSTKAPAWPNKAIALVALFGTEVILIQAICIPFSLNFDIWAFNDSGANLTVQYLVRNGYRPAIDFGYSYGLLPMLLDRLWFSFVGANPVACVVLIAMCNLLVAWAFVRFALCLELGVSGISCLAVAMPFAIQAAYPNLAHALEAALIANGVAEQAGGRRSSALVLAAAACLTKPSMGYFYGALLLTFIAWDLFFGKSTRARLRHLLLPALVSCSVLGILLCSVYGAMPFFRTLSPRIGMNAYRLQHLGFFRAGRGFWHFPGVRLGYYAGTVAGFWLIGTVWLVICGIWVLWTKVRNPKDTVHRCISHEIILTCAAMQLVFVSVLFGNSLSWFYYSYLLIMGIAATSSVVSLRYGVWFLTFLALFGQKTFCEAMYHYWISTAPSAETAQLWARSQERAEWHTVRALVSDKLRSRSAVLLVRTGCAELIFGEFAKPVTLYLDAGMPTDEEVARKQAQLRHASHIVILQASELGSWPEFKQALAGRTVVMRGKFFEIYR